MSMEEWWAKTRRKAERLILRKDEELSMRMLHYRLQCKGNWLMEAAHGYDMDILIEDVPLYENWWEEMDYLYGQENKEQSE